MTLNDWVERDRERLERGLATFAAWFRKNYPGPSTIISDPDWHAPKIFRAVASAILSTFPVAGIASDGVSAPPEGEGKAPAVPALPERFTGDLQLATEGRVIVVFSREVREYLEFHFGGWQLWTLSPAMPLSLETRFLFSPLAANGMKLQHHRRFFIHNGWQEFNTVDTEGTFEGRVLPTGDLICWMTSLREISPEKRAALLAAPTKQSPIDHDALTLFDELGPKRRT